MGLSKKQKKQIEAARKKLTQLRRQLSGAMRQPDDPGDVTRLHAEIAATEEQIKKIQEG
jgi:hypothetical protein